MKEWWEDNQQETDLHDDARQNALQRVAHDGWRLAPHGLEPLHHQRSLPLLDIPLAVKRPPSIPFSRKQVSGETLDKVAIDVMALDGMWRSSL